MIIIIRADHSFSQIRIDPYYTIRNVIEKWVRESSRSLDPDDWNLYLGLILLEKNRLASDYNLQEGCELKIAPNLDGSDWSSLESGEPLINGLEQTESDSEVDCDDEFVRMMEPEVSHSLGESGEEMEA